MSRCALWFVLLIYAAGSNAQEPSPAKQRLLDTQRAAVAEPYVGITTNGVAVDSLFPLPEKGVAARQTIHAARAFLDSLTEAQRAAISFAIDDEQWRRWSNAPPTIYDRRGVSFKELSPAQRDAANRLLRASLSSKGWRQVSDIVRLDTYPPGSYWLAMFGAPSSDAPWGWQLQGHHLAINYFILRDQVVMTPLFLGGEPATTLLQPEQNQALAFIASLSDEQKSEAVIRESKLATENVAEAFKDNLILDPVGLSAAKMNADQRRRLIDLIGEYVDNLPAHNAREKLSAVRRHLDETYFAWSGATDRNAVFYYRIYSPVILIEFDHQPPFALHGIDKSLPTRQHIHAVVRTPNGNDYGWRWLRPPR